jgi:hypothetical protein
MIFALRITNIAKAWSPDHAARMDHFTSTTLKRTFDVVGAVIGFIFGGVRFGFGVLFGGALAFGNYYWLKSSTAAIFENAFSGAGQGWWLPLRYISRYFALGAVILAVHFSGAMPAAAVIAGLAAFAMAVVADGFISIFRRNI